MLGKERPCDVEKGFKNSWVVGLQACQRMEYPISTQDGASGGTADLETSSHGRFLELHTDTSDLC